MSGSSRADALVAAAETLDALDIDQGSVVDPFAAIEQLGLTLSIVRLNNLLGAVVRRGRGGVLITSERSPAIQRYTAAHEIGHWILHEKLLTADGDAEVLGHPLSKIEHEAQLFAGYFLMPPPLLDRAVNAYGLQVGQIAPEQVYRLSRDMDVSFEAAARRLFTARLLTRDQLQDVLSFGRMRAMERASAGHRPADGLADMWDATIDGEVVNLVVEEHDEVLIQLPEQRLAGWTWQTAEELAERGSGLPRPTAPPVGPARIDVSRPDADLLPDGARASNDGDSNGMNLPAEVPPPARPRLEPQSAVVVESAHLASSESETPSQLRRRRQARAAESTRSASVDHGMTDTPVGGTGVRSLVVRTVTPGHWELGLYYAHAYDPRTEPLLTYQLQLTVQPTPNTAFRLRRLQSDLDVRLPGDPDDEAVFV